MFLQLVEADWHLKNQNSAISMTPDPRGVETFEAAFHTEIKSEEAKANEVE